MNVKYTEVVGFVAIYTIWTVLWV